MNKTLTLIRGIPGSGKSTVAQALQKYYCDDSCWIEADMFWIGEDGTYNFDIARLEESHAWCRKEVATAMSAGHAHVIVSNTFTRRWEMEEYVDMADLHGYQIQYINCYADFGNVHGCPENIVAKMKDRFQHAPLPTPVSDLFVFSNGYVGSH